MPETTEIRNPVVPQAANPPATADGGAWPKFKLFCRSAFFWSYARGGWQYDIICLVILAFIFLTPRSWFRDRPTLQLIDLRHVQGVIDVGKTKTRHIYQIDARLVDSVNAGNPEDAIRHILTQQLKKTPEIKDWDAIRDKNQVILGYTVVIAQ